MHSPLWMLAPNAVQPLFREPAAARAPEADGPAAFSFPSPDREEDRGYSLDNGVAVIAVSGTITRKAVYSYWSGKPLTQGQDAVFKALAGARRDPAVKAILLAINSPGGVVAGTKELADCIAEIAAEKPMAAYADGCMASSAFYLGSATGRVLAPVTAYVGCIGVFWVHENWAAFNEKLGVSYSYIAGGKWKTAGNPDNPLSDEERAYFQRQIEQLHGIFKADVARFLGISAPAEQWAEGQSLLAEDAKAVGLVSEIVRDLPSAVNLLRMEATMSKPADSPQASADIQAEAKKIAEAAGQAVARVLAMVKAVAGEEAQATVEKLVQAQVTPEQLAAMSSLFEQPAAATPPAKDPEAEARAAILAGLHAATPGAVPTGKAPAGVDPMQAAIERISKINA